jgi:biopolymer transport protein ExbD
MSFGPAGSGGVRSDINITPLVDVVLVLLIIFMVMTPTLLKQMELTVPDKADTLLTPPPTTMDQIVVGVTAEGKISINKEMIAEAALTERMHDLMKSSRDKLVFFDIDDDANYGDVMHVMDVVRGAGAKILGVMTK